MFNYRIYENVYEAMISGKKHIEIRLLNEKSESIKKGDTIKFDVLDTDKSLMVEVVDKYVFKDVNELWKYKHIVASSSMNYTKEEFYNALCQIFGKENVDNSKLVAIQFKMIGE